MVQTLQIVALAWIPDNTWEVQTLGGKSQTIFNIWPMSESHCFPRTSYRWPVGGRQSGEWRTKYFQTSRPEIKGETKSLGHCERAMPGLGLYFPRPYRDRELRLESPQRDTYSSFQTLKAILWETTLQCFPILFPPWGWTFLLPSNLDHGDKCRRTIWWQQTWQLRYLPSKTILDN